MAIVVLGLFASVAISAVAPAKPIGQRVEAKRAQVGEDRAREGVLTSTVARYGRRIAGLRERSTHFVQEVLSTR